MIILAVVVAGLTVGLFLTTMEVSVRERVLGSTLTAAVVGVPFVPTLLSGKNSYDSTADAALSNSSLVQYLGYVAVALALAIMFGRGTRTEGSAGYGAFVPVLIGLGTVSIIHGELGYMSRVVGTALVVVALGWTAVTRRATFVTIRALTTVAVLSSLVASRLTPQLAFVPRENASRDFFGFGSRLVGLAGTPNYMALVATVCFLAWLVSRRSKARTAMLLATFGTVVWSQGRNSLLVVGCGLLVYAVGVNGRRRWSRLALILIVAGSMAAPVLALALPPSSPLRPTIESLTTGRIDAWEISWQQFLSSPLTGYGPSFLSPEFWAVGSLQSAEQYSNSHNQWLEALSQGGLILGVCTAVSVGLLAKSAMRSTSGGRHRRALLVVSMLIFVQLSFGTPLRVAGLTWNLISVALIVSVSEVALRPVRERLDLRHGTLRYDA